MLSMVCNAQPSDLKWLEIVVMVGLNVDLGAALFAWLLKKSSVADGIAGNRMGGFFSLILALPSALQSINYLLSFGGFVIPARPAFAFLPFLHVSVRVSFLEASPTGCGSPIDAQLSDLKILGRLYNITNAACFHDGVICRPKWIVNGIY